MLVEARRKLPEMSRMSHRWPTGGHNTLNPVLMPPDRRRLLTIPHRQDWGKARLRSILSSLIGRGTHGEQKANAN